MTNEQIIGMILGNAATFGFLIKIIVPWSIKRAIEYTHLERDVKELQAFEIEQNQANKDVQKDLKGLSMKIDKAKENKT